MGVQGKMSDWHTHVFTSTYTADVSGVCSFLYELSGMTILHDPSGCNSTYTTHDEPRWYDSKSLMFVSGLDEMTAVLGDDSVLIEDASKAAADLHPRFIALCGASIPHVIAFDYTGVSHLIEERTGIPTIGIPTDGLKNYVSGVGLAEREWIRRFANIHIERKEHTFNLLGVTPIDFADQVHVQAMTASLQNDGFSLNACSAMGSTFEDLQRIKAAAVNVVPTSCGRIAARYMEGIDHIPYVEGIPIGPYMHERIQKAMQQSEEDGISRTAYDESTEQGNVLIIGEEVYARSMATAFNHSSLGRDGNMHAYAFWPDISEGLNEDDLMRRIDQADLVIADPLFKNIVQRKDIAFYEIPHIGYSGRIYRHDIPLFCSKDFKIEEKLRERK
jgi:hypothetical protein